MSKYFATICCTAILCAASSAIAQQTQSVVINPPANRTAMTQEAAQVQEMAPTQPNSVVEGTGGDVVIQEPAVNVQPMPVQQAMPAQSMGMVAPACCCPPANTGFFGNRFGFGSRPFLYRGFGRRWR